MKITVNGEAVDLEANTSVAQLLTIRQIDSPDMVTVHLNGKTLDSRTLDDVILNDGDEAEFVFFMGGGKYI